MDLGICLINLTIFVVVDKFILLIISELSRNEDLFLVFSIMITMIVIVPIRVISCSDLCQDGSNWIVVDNLNDGVMSNVNNFSLLFISLVIIYQCVIVSFSGMCLGLGLALESTLSKSHWVLDSDSFGCNSKSCHNQGSLSHL